MKCLDCNKQISVKNNPSDYCSEPCWASGNYSDCEWRKQIKEKYFLVGGGKW